MSTPTVYKVDRHQADSVVETLCEAFQEYPVMRYVLGTETGNFEHQFPKLIRLFVMARVLKNDPLFGIGKAGSLQAVATISLPGNDGIPTALADLRNRTWQELGQAPRLRYKAFCDACEQFDVAAPHYHLNMIGVRKACRGKGYARLLVEHIIGLSNADTRSAGVSLSTENQTNLPFYEKLGFGLTGHAVVGPGLETWNFFKPNTV